MRKIFTLENTLFMAIILLMLGLTAFVTRYEPKKEPSKIVNTYYYVDQETCVIYIMNGYDGGISVRLDQDSKVMLEKSCMDKKRNEG